MQARLLHLDPIRDLDGYAALRRLAGGLGGTYSITELAAEAARHPETTELATRIDNFELADWSLWRRAGETSIASVDVRQARCIVLDLGSLPRAQERSIVALAVLGRRWARRAGRNPVLFAVDEAHNVFPAATDDPLLQVAADVEELTSLFSHVPTPLLRRALGFGLGQALLAGPISPVPFLAQIGARHTRGRRRRADNVDDPT